MAVIAGEVPIQILARTRGVIAVRYTTRWGAVWAKWPRKRGRRIPPITVQQQTTWDWVQAALAYSAPAEVALTYAATGGTGFYSRDMLIMAMYGHFISWRGWGPWPFGVQFGTVGHYDTVQSAA